MRVMLAGVLAATPWGTEARAVYVEVDCRFGLPQMHIVGLLAAHRDTGVLVSSLAQEFHHLTDASLDRARRFVILTVGCTVLLVGLATAVNPKTALLVMAAGTASPGIRLAWERLRLCKIRRAAGRMRRVAAVGSDETGPSC